MNEQETPEPGIAERLEKFVRDTAENADPDDVGDTVLAGSSILLPAAVAAKYSTLITFTGGTGALVATAAILSAHTDINPGDVARRAAEGSKTGVNPQTKLGLAAISAAEELHQQGQMPDEADQWLEALDIEDIERGIEKAPDSAPDDIDITDDELASIGAIVASMYSISDLDEDHELAELVEDTDDSGDGFFGALPAAG